MRAAQSAGAQLQGDRVRGTACASAEGWGSGWDARSPWTSLRCMAWSCKAGSFTMLQHGLHRPTCSPVAATHSSSVQMGSRLRSLYERFRLRWVGACTAMVVWRWAGSGRRALLPGVGQGRGIRTGQGGCTGCAPWNRRHRPSSHAPSCTPFPVADGKNEESEHSPTSRLPQPRRWDQAWNPPPGAPTVKLPGSKRRFTYISACTFEFQDIAVSMGHWADGSE